MPRQKIAASDLVSNLDRLPEQERFYYGIEETFRSLASFYGFETIYTPPIEDARLFLPLFRAGFFEERPPVICKTSGGADFLLRPSGILGIFRAYGAHKMNDLPHPIKLLFEGESFYASPAKHSGNPVRSVAELGLCMIGEEGPIAEAEIVQVIWKTLEKQGIDHGTLELRVNATGCQECRQSFRSPFVAYFRSRAYRLCKNCKRHLKKNPTKILSCREESCRGLIPNAPQVLDYLCEVCKKHLRGVLEFLDEAKIPYFLDHKFFKDGTLFGSLVFEIAFKAPILVVEGGVPGEQVQQKSAVVLAEGGRVSRAGELVAGKRLDVVAGTLLISAAEHVGRTPLLSEELQRPRVFLAQLGELAKKKSLGLIETLRLGGIQVHESLGRDSVKSQLKIAERLGTDVALIFGQKEALDDSIIVREIYSGIQETIPQEKLVDFLKRRLRK